MVAYIVACSMQRRPGMSTAAIQSNDRRPVLAPGRGKTTLRVRGKMIAYGFLSWAIVFAGAMAMFPWRAYNRPLFESSIAVILAATTALLGAAYFGRRPNIRARDGLVLGIVWVAINLLLDLAAFSAGPMKMAPGAYFTDIGVTYLMIPVLTTVIAGQRRTGAEALRSAES
jgi:hypothetical protein